MFSLAGVISTRSETEVFAKVRRMTESFSTDPQFKHLDLSHPGLQARIAWVTQGQTKEVVIHDGSKSLILLGSFAADCPLNRTSPSFGSLAEGLEAGLLRWINGWFAGVFVDHEQGQVAFFNDRFGLGRLYVSRTSHTTHFSTSAKALIQLEDRHRVLDARSLGEYLSCGCVLENRSLFSGIEVQPPGSLCRVMPGHRIETTTYFGRREWLSQPSLSLRDYYARLTEFFARVLPTYGCLHGSMAMSLTGGVDSRMVMAWINCTPGSLPCYTFSSKWRDSQDVEVARRVAAASGQPFQTIPVDDDFFNQFPLLAQETIALTDGSLDVSGAVELYVNRVAKQIAPVRLTGNYGGEVLRGLVAFKAREVNPTIYADELVRQGRCAQTNYGEISDSNRRLMVVTKQLPWHHYGRFALEQSQLEVVTPFLHNELVSLAFQAPFVAEPGKDSAFHVIKQGSSALSMIQTDRARGSSVGSKLGALYQNCLFRAEYYYDYGMPFWLARIDNALRPLGLEKLFLGHHRFYHFRFWYGGKLAGFVKEVLLDPRSLSRSHLKRSAVESLVVGHTSGKVNATKEIHQLLSLELIHRQLLGTN